MTLPFAPDLASARSRNVKCRTAGEYSPAVRAVRSDENPSYFTISLAPASRVTPPNVPLKVIV